MRFGAAAVAVAVGAANVTQADCTAIPVITDPMSKLPAYTVMFSEGMQQCQIECDVHPTVGSTMVGVCVNLVDPLHQAMEDAKLIDDATCTDTSLNAPGTPSTEIDAEMSVISCPDWFLWFGWTRGDKRTLGNSRTEIALKSTAAIDAFVKMVKTANAAESKGPLVV